MLLSSQRDTHSKCKRRTAMKKNNSNGKELTQDQKIWKGPITIGMDLGDRTSRYCILDGNGEKVREGASANESGHDTAIGPGEAKPDRAGSGNAFALDQPFAEGMA
jgi:hypothetical protein